MSTLNKLILSIFIINIFMYLGVNFAISADGTKQLNDEYKFRFNNDLFDTFLTGNTDFNTLTEDFKNNWTNYGYQINDSFNALPDKESGRAIGTGDGVTFLDELAIVWAFIATLGNILVAPLTLFFNFKMPLFVGLMIGLPYFLILVLSLFAMIRGVGD